MCFHTGMCILQVIFMDNTLGLKTQYQIVDSKPQNSWYIFVHTVNGLPQVFSDRVIISIRDDAVDVVLPQEVYHSTLVHCHQLHDYNNTDRHTNLLPLFHHWQAVHPHSDWHVGQPYLLCHSLVLQLFCFYLKAALAVFCYVSSMCGLVAASCVHAAVPQTQEKHHHCQHQLVDVSVSW